MGSAHPRAAYGASQEGSSNLNKLFKKRVFSCGFEAVMKVRHANIASINGASFFRLTAISGQAICRAQYESLIALGMTRAELGPCSAIAQDMRTGRLSAVYQNEIEGLPPVDLNNIIDCRLPYVPAYLRTSGPGSHAEVYAANEILNARPGATLDDIVIFAMETGFHFARPEFGFISLKG